MRTSECGYMRAWVIHRCGEIDKLLFMNDCCWFRCSTIFLDHIISAGLIDKLMLSSGLNSAPSILAIHTITPYVRTTSIALVMVWGERRTNEEKWEKRILSESEECTWKQNKRLSVCHWQSELAIFALSCESFASAMMQLAPTTAKGEGKKPNLTHEINEFSSEFPHSSLSRGKWIVQKPSDYKCHCNEQQSTMIQMSVFRPLRDWFIRL